jgi:Chlorite dismutase
MVEKTQAGIDIQEHGRDRDGTQRTSDRRLFMQLHVFGACTDRDALIQELERRSVEAVLYQDVNYPRGVGVLTMQEDPKFFATTAAELFNSPPFRPLVLKEELTMFGRTYSTGFEPELEDWLLDKPRRTALNPAWPWALWYPLRRTGAFSSLPREEQGPILREHGMIGRGYAEQDLAHDIRLACHGIDSHDNEFVIGLVGKELFPLSHLVQTMRKTKQTSQYIQSMGPFFVGYAVWQSPSP